MKFVRTFKLQTKKWNCKIFAMLCFILMEKITEYIFGKTSCEKNQQAYSLLFDPVLLL